ncbi:hypothetical protein PSMK_31890 [Phycisphaera mikurensis NBRC 102666]|uniref:Uncharacterized protein n=1 Tax=Phycisphaera mikurensis (strain NBRC 102666 / KCTC 22515 / FYK2301M01) TaxID=1142394 RepID=I0IJB0_PHYMF|nr:hypothetical protein PSMK_31890 [Phycisphaera mikurensis NBRC 102666]
MTAWLPRRRTSSKPWALSGSQQSFPEKVRNLGNADLQRGDGYVAPQAVVDLDGICGLQKEFHRFLQVRPRLGDRVALARDVDFGADADVAVAVGGDDRGEVTARWSIVRSGRGPSLISQ